VNVLPQPLAELEQGACKVPATRAMKSVATMTALGPIGRPLVELNINGATALCFIDTGSEVTLIKPRALQLIDPEGHLHWKDSTRPLRGVSGLPFDTSFDVTLYFL